MKNVQLTMKYHVYKRGGVWLVRMRRLDNKGVWQPHRAAIAGSGTLEGALDYVAGDIRRRAKLRLARAN